MKRAAIAAIALSLLALSGCTQRALEEGPVAVKGTTAKGDPCAEYVSQGVSCEYLAFPEMQIEAGGNAELAGITR